MSRHRKAYVISYHGVLCHDMSYVMTIVASLISSAQCKTESLAIDFIIMQHDYLI